MRHWRTTHASDARGAALALSLLLSAHAGAADEGGVYVAGEGFSLEQAASQAREETADGGRFWLVLSGDEARRAVRGEADGLLRSVREGGGIVYVCERDAASSPAAAMDRTEPPIGLIARARGGGPEISPPQGMEYPPLPASDHSRRLLLRTCGALE